MSYAARHHAQFALFTQNNYRKLNSRINLSDLYNYAGLFDNSVHKRFGEIIKRRKSRMNKVIGKDFPSSYGQILSWRHDFAHAGIRNTTVDEALATHKLAKLVLHAFDDAFV